MRSENLIPNYASLSRSFVLTDTAAAARIADAALSIRDQVASQSALALFKGADLYGNDSRSAHTA